MCKEFEIKVVNKNEKFRHLMTIMMPARKPDIDIKLFISVRQPKKIIIIIVKYNYKAQVWLGMCVQ